MQFDDFPLKIVRFQTLISIREKYLLEGKIKIWHLGCFILTTVKGKLILFNGEFATAPQTLEGLSSHIDDFSAKIVRFQTLISIRQKYLLEGKIKFWHLGCFILTTVKGKKILFRVEFARAP